MKRGSKRISETFAKWLLFCLAAALVVTTAFIYVLQTRLSENDSQQLLRLNIADVQQDIMDASDANLLELAQRIAQDMNAVETLRLEDLQYYLYKYDLSEINVIDENGIIVLSTYAAFLGFDMASGEQSGEFMVLLNGEKEYVQSYQAVSYDASLFRKYAGVALDKGGFVQVGYDAERFQRDIDEQVVGLTRNRHVGAGGRILICDSNRNIVSNAKGFDRETLDLSSFGVNPADIRQGERFTATIDGERYYCMMEMSEGYFIIAIMPVGEQPCPVMCRLA